MCVVTLVGFKQLFTTRKRELRIKKPPNMILVPIPLPQFSFFFVEITCIIMSFIFAFLASMLRKLRKLDLIYIRASHLAPGFMLMDSLRKITVVKIPAIVEDEIVDNNVESIFVKKLSSFLDKLVIIRSKRVAVPNPLLGDFLMKRRCVKPKEPWLILPAGVDLRLIERVRYSPEICNSEDNVHKIGFIGTLAWWQGVDILAKAASLLKSKVPDLELFIVGDGPMREEVARICEEYKIECTITGSVSHEEALKYLRNFDVLVLPRRRTSVTESIIPIKVVEAWALGIPVIVTSHEVFKSVYKDGEDVLYTEPNPEDVADKISLLVSNRKLREKLAKKGPTLVRDFDYIRIAKKLLISVSRKVNNDSE